MIEDRDERMARIGEIVAKHSAVRSAFPDPEPATLPSGSIDEQRTQWWLAAIPSKFVWAETADFEPSVASVLTEWAIDPRGRNLVLFGAVGSGKSHGAVAACRLSFFRGLDVMFLPVVEMLDELRPGGPDGYLKDLMAVDRLILDDLGLERHTDWTAERLYALVNRRWMEERPTVATTNLSPEALEEAIGPRMFSRLMGGAVTLGIVGPDRREA